MNKQKIIYFLVFNRIEFKNYNAEFSDATKIVQHNCTFDAVKKRFFFEFSSQKKGRLLFNIENSEKKRFFIAI